MSSPLFDLTGRVAVVTGTSRGLGQAIARALAAAISTAPSARCRARPDMSSQKGC